MPPRWLGLWTSERNLHNYFNLHVCPSIRRRRRPTFEFSIPDVVSHSVTNKSSLICVKSEKYAFLVTTRPLGSKRWGEAELHTLQDQERRSQATYTKTSFSVSSPLQCRSQAVVCVSTPRMYPRSGYFLLIIKFHFTHWGLCWKTFTNGVKAKFFTTKSWIYKIVLVFLFDAF